MICGPHDGQLPYGGFGGVAFYHVSDLYVALFSRFIPCGAYEDVYILDPFYKNKSDIQPDTVLADTHGQSAAIFGLAYILGIQLMLRIRNWKHLVMYRSTKETHYQHIDGLLTGVVDWDLIATCCEWAPQLLPEPSGAHAPAGHRNEAQGHADHQRTASRTRVVRVAVECETVSRLPTI